MISFVKRANLEKHTDFCLRKVLEKCRENRASLYIQTYVVRCQPNHSEAQTIFLRLKMTRAGGFVYLIKHKADVFDKFQEF